jgi:hypothetical protein
LENIKVLVSVINLELGHVNAKVVLVGKSIVDLGNRLVVTEDLLLHLVKSGLNRGRVVLGKGVHGDLLDRSVNFREVNLVSEDRGLVALESPGGINGGGEDTVPDFREGGVLIPVEAVEGRASGLEDKQVLESRLDGDLVAITVVNNVGGLDILTITDKGVRVEFTVNQHTRPLVLDDLDVGNVNVLVLLEDVLSDLLGKEFNVINVGTALGHDVNSVLAGICLREKRNPGKVLNVKKTTLSFQLLQ